MAEDSAARPKKRPRVKRACDRCFSSKDKCNGETPCGMCQKTKSQCTYDRPQQRRGPQAGMRTKLEAKIEILESILGYFLDQLDSEIRLKVLPTLDLNAQMDDDNHSSPDQEEGEEAATNDIYPSPKNKSQMAALWRKSDFASTVAPSLGLELGSKDPKEEDGDSKKKPAATKPTKTNKSAAGVGTVSNEAESSKGKGKARIDSATSSSSSSVNNVGHQRQESETGGSPFSSGMGPPQFGAAPGFHQRNASQSSNQNLAIGIRSPAFQDNETRLPPGPSSPNRIWERSPHALHQPPFTSANYSHQVPQPHYSAMYAPPAPLPSSSRQYLPPSRARSNATHQLLEQMATLPRELEEELDNLLSAFFQHYHIITPFVDKAALLRWTSENGVRRFSQAAVSGEQTGTLALVLAICSLSAARSADAAKVGDAETAERLRLISLSEDCHARARALFFCSESGSVINSGAAHSSPGGRADGTGDFEAVQCMLILAIVDIIQNRSTRAWIGLGMAIRLAQDMGLQLEGRNINTPAPSRVSTPRPSSSSIGKALGSPSGLEMSSSKDGTATGDRERTTSFSANSNLPPQPSPLSNKPSTSNHNQNQATAAQHRSKIHADQIRRLTWWALFNYDSFLSIALGRPTAIRRSEFDTLHPDPAESDEEWALCTAHSPCALAPDSQELQVGPTGLGKTVKARMISTFVAQTGLSEVLSDLARIVQTKAQPKPGGESVVAQHHALLARLHEWRNNLPSHLQDCIVANETPTSLAGPSMPTSPSPPNVWSLALHYHFAFIIAQRALAGALAKERADALAPQATDPLVDDNTISSLWDTRAARIASARSGEDSKNQSSGVRNSSSGKSDFFKVTIASPTSEHALPRLLARYISAFGPASLPPTSAFYALASAHALISPTSPSSDTETSLETQKAWENLTWAVSTSVAWHPGLRQVAKLLPIFSRAAAATSKTMLRLNPDPSPVLNPNSPLFNFNPHLPHSNGLNGFGDLLPYSFDSTADELGSDAHALAYALGLPGDAGNTPSSNSQQNLTGQGLQMGSPLQHLNYSHGGAFPSFLAGSRAGTPGGRSEEGGDPLARLFDMGGTDQNSVLFQLGLHPDGPAGSRRSSMAFGLPTSSSANHPIQGTPWNNLTWPPHQPQGQHYSPNAQDAGLYSAPKEGSNRRFGMSDASSAGGWNPGGENTNPPTPLPHSRPGSSSSASHQQRPGPSHHHISPHHQQQMQAQPTGITTQPHQSYSHHQPMQSAPTPKSLVPDHLSNDPNAALGAYDLDMSMNDFGSIGDLIDHWKHRGSN